MKRRTLISAIGVVALSSAYFFPMTSYAAALKGEGGRPVRIVVPYPPGGPLDVSARAIADAVKDKLAQRRISSHQSKGTFPRR